LGPASKLLRKTFIKKENKAKMLFTF